ncbi:hypothetical protein SPHINGOT1_310004 [Sphingomonas sp. T1]|nr:hypothetical protein SPHINGOT1_310004 [Sphingomonas sp. T1]
MPRLTFACFRHPKKGTDDGDYNDRRRRA